ncbi:IS21 family transposase [Thiolapillus sp.]|uniref:IS21 family transposase n=1 Tax=Thiolapillus sp. TaxID=2017437 RepID=UPI003AF9CF18
METIAKIRRRHEVNGESISEIARRFNLSRNTVRKYLNQSDPQRYQRRQQPKPQLGAYEDQLKTWLEQDSQRPKKQRRTARRLFEDLQGAGYTGAYDSVQRFVKRWKQARPALTKAFVPLVFPAGDAAQFDWSHEQVELGGVVQTIKLTHFRLAHSRQPFLVAYFRESLEMVLDAHDRAFTFWGGIPQRMIYDNPRTLVDAVKVGKARRFNRQFLALANHYLFEPVACTPASGWEKGQVENQVGNVREWLFSPRPRFKDLAELNAWLEQHGSRIVQSDSGEGWNSEKVEKAFNLKAGIYNIYTASPADKKRASFGVIVHADKDSVYQQCGKKLLCIRAMISIEYLE